MDKCSFGVQQHFIVHTFHQLAISPTGHFTDRSFNQLGHFTSQTFHQLDISPTGHFTDIDRTFHQLDILLTCQFINWTFHQLDISPTGNFTNWIFHQPDISPTWHFTDRTFHHCEILLTGHFTNLTFYWQDISLARNFNDLVLEYDILPNNKLRHYCLVIALKCDISPSPVTFHQPNSHATYQAFKILMTLHPQSVTFHNFTAKICQCKQTIDIWEYRLLNRTYCLPCLLY